MKRQYIANRERLIAEQGFADVRRMANKLFDIENETRKLEGSTKTRQFIVDTALEYLRRVTTDVRLKPDMALEVSGTVRSLKRDGAFRDAVVSVWGHSCAFCGYSIQLDRSDLGSEAAHIRWVQFGGPDAVNNGLACCSIHHQDRGAISVSTDGRVLVSSRVYGGGGLQSHFLAIHGSPLREPNQKRAAPKAEFLAWHRKEVFRSEARD